MGSDRRAMASTEDGEALGRLLVVMVQTMVHHPEDIRLEIRRTAHRVQLRLMVNPVDVRIVIGKGGQTIRAITNILTESAKTLGVWVDFELVKDR